MDFFKEIEGKRYHDPCNINNINNNNNNQPRCVWIKGAIIIGAGPSGLAASACLRSRNIQSIILERSNCIASLWQHKTYDRLRLHLPKQFCELPFMPFPENFPTYPSKQQFIKYLEDYAEEFKIRPFFDQAVVSAEFDGNLGLWRVVAEGVKRGERIEYVSKYVVVATGENAEAVVPEIEGVEEYEGRVMHTSLYKSGDFFEGKRVLVVGCGNSGMEVCLDLCNHNAMPSLVVRDTVHVLPQVMLGRSTFGLSMSLLKWFPIRLVDRLLLIISWLIIGDTGELGLHRPKVGPLELKNLSGKTPVLDVGTLAKIRCGHIKVCPGVRRLTRQSVEFTNGRREQFDAIILATGYKSNVPSWLKESEMFSKKDGLPKRPFPNGWKGECGLYAVGFTKRGLLGASMDAQKIAEDIERCSKLETKHPTIVARAP